MNSGDSCDVSSNPNKLHIYVQLSSFISKKNLSHFIYCILSVYSIITIYCILSVNVLVSEVIDTKMERLKSVSKISHNVDVISLCVAVDCIMYKHKIPRAEKNVIDSPIVDVWKNSAGDFLPGEYSKNILKHKNSYFPKYSTIEFPIRYNHHNEAIEYGVFVINNLRYLQLSNNLIKDSLLIAVLFVLILYITIIYIIEKNNAYEKYNYKYTLENKLQRNITESLYHEMVNPLSVIHSLIKEVYCSMYGSRYDKETDTLHVTNSEMSPACRKFSGVLDGPGNKCGICALEILEQIDEYRTPITSSINRLFSTINLVSGVKKIKYSNGSVPIYDIITNAVSSANLSSVSKLSFTINNDKIFKTYSVSGNLNNGDVLNVLTIMITNSLEAYSDHITFSCTLEYPKLHIYIKDNGRGIRDDKDRVIVDYGIFNYGTSSKDPTVKKTFIEKALNNISLAFNYKHSTRGVGLSLNKELLRKCNGDIRLVDTSPHGTEFEIILPVKATEVKKRELKIKEK